MSRTSYHMHLVSSHFPEIRILDSRYTEHAPSGIFRSRQTLILSGSVFLGPKTAKNGQKLFKPAKNTCSFSKIIYIIQLGCDLSGTLTVWSKSGFFLFSINSLLRAHEFVKRPQIRHSHVINQKQTFKDVIFFQIFFLFICVNFLV